MSMRTTSLRRRQHVLMRLRQRVDPRRCRWVNLCRAVEMSLVVHKGLNDRRSLAWITYRNRQVYVVWDSIDEEIVTVLGEDYAAVLAWQDEMKAGVVSAAG